MRNKIDKVIDILTERKSEWTRRKGLVGFDGFVDSLVRPIRKKDDDKQFAYFQEMAEFGQYVLSKQGLSSCIELDNIAEKAGGNGPIMAGALGKLGVRMDCVGAMGVPGIHPVFQSLRGMNCVLHSYAQPGYTTSLEFAGGKLMLARMNEFNSIDWEDIKTRIGLEKLIGLFRGSDTIGIVNWSEIFHANTIWKGILEEILPILDLDRPQDLFMDLSDCSGRKREHIQDALAIMKRYARYCRVAFGMNENEARLICGILYDNAPADDIDAMGAGLYESLGIDTLLIHRAHSCSGWNRQGVFHIDNYNASSPVLLTGAGDNFNAGYCAAKLLDLDIESSLIVAHAVAGFYVRNGFSPTTEELVRLLREWREAQAALL